MAEGVSPAAKKPKVGGPEPHKPAAAEGEGETVMMNGNGRIAFVTGITGQVR